MENQVAQGRQVGMAARRQFPGGELIGHPEDPAAALEATAGALARPGDITLFEPALRHEEVLVRADVLVRREGAYRMIEVKASTRVRPHHVTDAAVQAWVAQGAGLPLERFELAHVDKAFVYPGGDDYAGLFAYEDVTAAVAPLQDQIPAWVEAAQRDLAGPMPDIDVGPQCKAPFTCEFLPFCAPEDAPYPVGLLPHGAKLARRLCEEGFRDLRDVPLDRLDRDDHRRIWRVTVNGQAELDPAAAATLATLPYPRHYLDFETVGPAVPLWPGTRPYEKIPMQWSCHLQEADGTLAHLPPFLDTTGADPRRAFAESLVTAVAPAGTIFVYNAAFERGVLMQLAAAFPDLAPALEGMAARLFDLLPFAREHYYHPAMLGSWSIKRVLPTIAPDLDYGNLGSVQSGDMVEPAYFELIDAATPVARKVALTEALLTYCERDTLAMVRLAAFLGQRDPPGMRR